jgi:anti-anti-sigma factor
MKKHFDKQYLNNVEIIIVNLPRATIQYADEMQSILQKEIKSEQKNIVIDLSQCDYIDSIFLGAVIYASKKMKEMSGQIKIVEPAKLPRELFTIPIALHLLEFYKSREEAINSFTS